MAKVTYIRLPDPGTSNLRGIGKNMSREFKIGSPCPSDWGGGVIASMEVDRSMQAVVVRKSTPFVGPMEGNGTREAFDAVCVPLARLSQFTLLDEPKPAQVETKPEDPPAAKPAQQQNQQRR